MSVSVQIGLLLALATALASVLGFLYKHRGAIASPEVEMRRPLRTSFALFRNPWYTLGILIAMAGWGFHVGALALAPISLVQATIAGGLVMLTVCADRLFAHEVTRREWIGVALAALGLAFLAGTIGDTGDEAHSDYEAARLVVFIAIVGVARAWSPGRRAEPARGRAFGASAGLFWAASDTAIKALSGNLGDESAAAIVLHPLGGGDRAGLARRPRGLRPQPPGRQGGAGDRGDQRRRERADDRRGADRVRGAHARRAARRHRAHRGVRPGDLRGGADPGAGQRRGDDRSRRRNLVLRHGDEH